MHAAETEGAAGAVDCWTSGYWLEHCEDFSVESAEGKLGYVALVDTIRSELIVIGEEGVTTVRFGEIDHIDPHAERITLATARY
jgi:hypothetical protein